MLPEARRFYQRYNLLTFVLPVIASATLIYLLRYAGLKYTFEQDRTLYFFWGTLFMLAGAFLMPYFSALGFRLSGVPKLSRSPDPAQQARLAAALAPSGKLNQEFQTRIVSLGNLPMLAIGGARPAILWISEAVLDNTPADDLPCLIAHERAHLSARGWFDDAFAYWVFFTMSSTILLLPFPWPIRIALLMLAPLLLLRLRLVWNNSREREADLLAAEEIGKERYALALARHLAQFESPAGSVRLRLQRLRWLGYTRSEAEQLIAAAST